MNWYLKVLNDFRDFSGRARRKEYWMFILFNIIFAGIAASLDNFLGLYNYEYGSGPINGIYGLILIVPSLAVAVRRLHDIGKSGWMLLVVFIPLIGAIWLIVLFAREGELGANQYGPNPKEELIL